MFQALVGAYSVFADDKPARWTIWDLDGCIGEISLDGDTWHAHPDRQADSDHLSWQEAAQAVVSA